MKLFCASIKRNSVSLFNFPLRNHVYSISCNVFSLLLEVSVKFFLSIFTKFVDFAFTAAVTNLFLHILQVSELIIPRNP